MREKYIVNEFITALHWRFGQSTRMYQGFQGFIFAKYGIY